MHRIIVGFGHEESSTIERLSKGVEMESTEFLTIVGVMACVLAPVVWLNPESFVVGRDVYENAPIRYKICIFIILLLIIIAVLYISLLRPSEIFLGI
ncbi:MAG: hypothetical protein IKF17_02110 [Clostridia bacterium]|nr:hypothetical protein [Clostridia bacterium]